MKKDSKEEFIKKVKGIPKKIYSKRGIEYNVNEVTDVTITIHGKTRSLPVNINIEELYEAYIKEDKINTTTLRKYIKTGRFYSPSYAVLIAMDLAT